MTIGLSAGTDAGSSLEDASRAVATSRVEAGAEGPLWRVGAISGPHLTKVGLWFVLISIVLGVAAANTGNNSLYLVIAAAVAMFFTSWWWSRRNVQGLELLVEVPEELYAGSPAEIVYRLRRTRGGATSDLLLVLDGSRAGTLVRRLDARSGADRGGRGVLRALRSRIRAQEARPRRAAGREATGRQDILFLQRGLHSVGKARALSIFPLGMFRWQVTFTGSRSVIVFPELFLGVRVHSGSSPKGWQLTGSRVGDSEDLHSLRAFQSGDDPRRIHWKQSARSDQLVFQQRSEDEVRRVSLLVDSYVPRLSDAVRSRFERLVSEAATACVEYLERGYEVELFLREGHVGFGSGLWQRRRLLEALALLECQTADAAALVEPDRAHRRVLRFSLTTVQPISEPSSSEQPAFAGNAPAAPSDGVR